MNPQELLQTSHRILITIPSFCSLQEKEAALGMLFSLLRLGKSVETEGMPVVSRFLARTSPDKREKTFAVTAKGLAPWVSKVYYEKDDRDLRLYFTLQDKNLSEYMLAVGEQRHDLVFIVGDKEASYNSAEPASRIVAFKDIQGHHNLIFALLSEENRQLSSLLAKAFLSAEFTGRDVLILKLSRQDFQNVGARSSLLSKFAGLVQEYGEGRFAYALLFEEASAYHPIRVLLRANSAGVKETVLRYGQNESKGAWTLVRSRFSSLEEARQEIIRDLS
ncbi:MAG: hypothetical protein HYV78_01040 [Candidatus Wildermuthbacteria bacterium]|nr:hypothetical protein [Candidatus Wildermuthbacteria bacterium]